MKNLLLSLVALLFFPAHSHAVFLSPNHHGQVLIYPYYTTRDGQDTLMSITNTSDDVKALKLRLLEGENGTPIASVNIYVGPRDTWVSSITEGPEGPMIQLITGDISCVQSDLPSLKIDYQFDYTSTNNDPGRQTVDRYREGYIEVIEMGTVNPNGLGRDLVVERQDERHDCTQILVAWTHDGAWNNDPQFDMGPPTGGLTGRALVIDVIGARAATMPVFALEHFYRPLNSARPVSLHTRPEDRGPGLNAAFPTVSQLLIEGLNGPQYVSDRWSSGALAVSAALMTERVQNQYLSDAQNNNTAEWVFTFPTKPYLSQESSGAIAPFTNTYRVSDSALGAQACELINLSLFDRDGTQPEAGIPLLPITNSLCYTTNVVSFNGTHNSQGATGNEANNIQSQSLRSRLFLNVSPEQEAGFNNGWAQIIFNGLGNVIESFPAQHQLVNPITGRVYSGLPALGYAQQSADDINNQALFGVGQAHIYLRNFVTDNP